MVLATSLVAEPPREDAAPKPRASASQLSRKHAVRRPGDVNVTGHVYDSQRNEAVVGAAVKIGSHSAKTNSSGDFTLNDVDGGKVALEVTRWGFETYSKEIELAPGTTNLDVPMISLPEVVVKTADDTVRLDADSVKFGYLLAFVGAVMNQTLDVCTEDGTISTLQKSEMSKIEGPAVRVAGGVCCPDRTAQKVRITLKNSGAFDALLTTSCPPYDMYISGLDKESTKSHYVRLDDAISIDFP